MHTATRFFWVVMIGACLLWPAGLAVGQTRTLSQAECQALRERLAEHARLSDGVRRMLASRAARYPAAQRPPSAAPDRARAIRSRLERIPREREQLDDQRIAALVRFDLARSLQLQGQIEALDAEKARLERELAALPPGASAPAPVQPAQPPVADVDRLPCDELGATYDAAIKMRRQELGAREDQAAVVPLAALKGQSREQIARELAAQFAAWPEAATQIGLLDQDGDGRIEGFVDVPVREMFRLFQQRSDGSLGIEVFALPGRAGDTDYGQPTRRLDEASVRHGGRQLADLLTSHPAGPVRVVAETADFGPACANFLAGNFAEAGRLQSAAARTIEFQNLRGDTGRLLEILTPVAGGVVMRRVVIVPRPNSEELWEETVITIRAASYWRSDVEVSTSRQTRTATGAIVGAPSGPAPSRFSLER